MMAHKPKIAIVHDWLYGGGAEQVVAALHDMYPDAPIYTSYCSDEWRQKLDNKVVTGYLQWRPLARLRKFLPLLRQWWFGSLDLKEFDIVISSSGNGEAKFVKTNEAQRHICYCHTPTHFYWRKYEEYLKNPGFRPVWLVRLGLRLLFKPLRNRDFRAAQKVDQFIANSSHIQKDIKRYYHRDSVVIHPPVDTEKFSSIKDRVSSKTATGFIMWGRHTPYKRFDLAIQACNQLKLPLTVVGSGPETNRLKVMAGPTITFTGWLDQSNLTAELTSLANQHKGFLFPAEEDFGISPVEAMALGLPVIAYKSGGALDYVVPGHTGMLFEKQTAPSLVQALSQFTRQKYNPKDLKRHAETFSKTQFQQKMKEIVDSSANQE